MRFSRQEYWSGLPSPSPGDLPDPGFKPRSPALQADALTSQPPQSSVRTWPHPSVHLLPGAAGVLGVSCATCSAQLHPTLRPQDCSPPGSPVHGDSPGKKTGVGCHALLQGIFPTQGSGLYLLSPALAGRFFTTSAAWEAHGAWYSKTITIAASNSSDLRSSSQRITKKV